VKKKLNNLGLN